MRATTLLICFVPSVVLAAVACGTRTNSAFSDDSGDSGSATEEAGQTIFDSGPGLLSDGASDGGLLTTDPHTPVDVMATADNAYAFGWGDENSVSTYIANPAATLAGEIFNCPVGGPARKGPALAAGTVVGPEAYTVPADQAPPGAYLYLVTWADMETTQGVIATFTREDGGTTVATGAGAWQACATGLAYDTSVAATAVGPTQAIVNAQITECNAGTGDPTTTSAGWVGPTGPISSTPKAVGKVAFGQDNGWTTDARLDGGDFQPTCGEPDMKDPDNGGIDPTAKWMWYAPPGFTGDPFQANGSNYTRSFLIFRLPAAAIPGPPR
jgi:hypothetical protein